jgi:DNA-directed RNA polymerase specialized sigma24 family protein
METKGRLRADAGAADRERVEALIEGKPEAFHRFFEEWFPRVYAFAHRRDPRAAEVVVARVFERVLEELPSWNGEPLARWILARARAEAGAIEARPR